MAGKRHKPEEIVAKLRQVEVLQSQGASAADAIESMRVPRAYARAVQRYFGALEREAAGDAAEPETTEVE